MFIDHSHHDRWLTSDCHRKHRQSVIVYFVLSFDVRWPYANHSRANERLSRCHSTTTPALAVVVIVGGVKSQTIARVPHCFVPH